MRTIAFALIATFGISVAVIAHVSAQEQVTPTGPFQQGPNLTISSCHDVGTDGRCDEDDPFIPSMGRIYLAEEDFAWVANEEPVRVRVPYGVQFEVHTLAMEPEYHCPRRTYQMVKEGMATAIIPCRKRPFDDRYYRYLPHIT